MALTFFRRPGSQPVTRNAQLVESAEAIAAQLRARDSDRLRRYRDLLDFYEGTHFASNRRGRSNLVVNYARVVADKGVSYLFGRGVHVSVPDAGLSPAPDPEALLGQL